MFIHLIFFNFCILLKYKKYDFFLFEKLLKYIIIIIIIIIIIRIRIIIIIRLCYYTLKLI